MQVKQVEQQSAHFLQSLDHNKDQDVLKNIDQAIKLTHEALADQPMNEFL